MPGSSDDDVRVRAILEDQLTEPAERVRRALEELDRSTQDLTESTEDLDQAQQNQAAAAREAERRQRELNRQHAEQERLVRNMTREYENEQRALDRATQAAERNRKEQMKSARNIGGFLKIQKMLLLNGLKLDILGQVATLINSLGAAAYAAVSGLAPLVGTLLPIPALLAGIAMYGVTAKLAFGGLGKAITAYRSGDMEKIAEATKDMGPNAKDAAYAFAALAKQMKPLKRLVQEKVLRGIADDVQLLGNKYFPLLEDHLAKAGDGFNTALSYATGFMALPQTISAMNRILGNSTKISTLFGHTLNGVLRATVHLMDAAGPTAVRMAQSMSDGINKLADKIYQNQERVAAFAERGYNLWLKVKAVLKDLGMGLFNIGKLSMGLAGDMGKGMQNMAKNFRAFTESAEGQAKIKKFFDDMKPNLVAIAGLMKALGVAMFQIGTSPHFAGIIDQLTNMVPVLVRLVELADGEYVPAVLSIIDSLGRLAAGMNIFGPLGVLLQGVAWGLKGIADFFEAMPDWVQQAAGLLFTFGLWAGFLTKMIKLFDLIFGTAIWTALRAAIISVGSWIWTAIIVPLVTFLFTNPIGWIILAVIALIAVFVILWKKCEGFRNLVKSIGQWFVDVWNNTLYPLIMKTWEWIKETWDKAYNFMKPYVVAIIDWVKSHWEQIKAIVAAVVTGVIEWFKFWYNVATTVFGAILAVAIPIFKGLWAVVKFVIDWIISGWQLIWPVVEAVVRLVVAIFKLGWNVIRLVVNVAILAIGLIIKGIVAVVKFVVDWVVNGWKFAWGIISTVVGTAIDIVMGIIGWIVPRVSAVIDAVKAYFAIGWAVVKEIVGAVVDFLSPVIERISSVVGGVIDTVKSVFETGWNFVSDIVGGAIDRIKSVIEPITDLIGRILDRIKSDFDRVWGAIRDFVMNIIDGIVGALDGITSVVTKISNGIGSVADKLPGLATGGPVHSGMTAMVGEKGPEAFVTKTGNVTPIGTHGPEIRKFNNAGYVVPNHVLGGRQDSSVPYNVMSKLNDAMAAHAAMRTGSGTAARTAVKERARNDYMGSSPKIEIKIGSVSSDVDMRNAVMQGIREWERSNNERR